MLDIAAAFPDVTLIFDHGGVQAGWWERFYEECLAVIAANDNVYVETGLWWRELYEKPLMDPNIGPSKLLWGTDWGASMQIYSQPGRYPPSYAVQLRGEGIPHYQVDYWGWSLRELTSVRIVPGRHEPDPRRQRRAHLRPRRAAHAAVQAALRPGRAQSAQRVRRLRRRRAPARLLLGLLLRVAHAHEPDERDERADEGEPGADDEGALVAAGQRGSRRSRPAPARSLVRWVAMVASAASPSEPPTWREVLTRPEASPASERATPATAAMVTGTKESPRPVVVTTPAQQDVADVGAVRRDAGEEQHPDRRSGSCRA